MAHQAANGKLHPEVLKAMIFDNRFKPSFESAEEKLLTAAFDGDTSVGYIFTTADRETEASKAARPACAAGLSGLPEYRGLHIASTLCAKAINWFGHVSDLHTVFVYISNGNESVIRFYESLGFRYSHAVFGGFILAYWLQL